MPVFDTFDSEIDDIATKCAGDDAGVRRVAMMELAERVDAKAVPLLVTGLRDADASVREAAAKALDEHEGPFVGKHFVVRSKILFRPCDRLRPKH